MFEKITSFWGGSTPAPTPEVALQKPYDPTDPKVNPLNPEGLKPCCACPQTKSSRDECYMRYGAEADEKCKDLVQQHITCMRNLGFRL
ncbi:hypothetical protein OE88DRAFT_1111325 [Heliocybe sulcata]|uniref:COX17-domain-containing protein n=1 Tax=Heliocybe sulcata TaxID=5364 RepID=A0A5C3MW17_9AGAM|nr:hypothetical protein OE88DRAFT_1111325 [Heliocybe sulcata]